MLYHLFDYLNQHYDIIGIGVFKYISFRAGMAVLFSLLIGVIYGKKWIGILQKKQIGEEIRKLGLEGQEEKKGTPTMGGLIIIASILVPTLLFAKLNNVYIILLIITTLGLGLIGFLDDYLKKIKKNKEGLAGKFKIIGQISIGLIAGLVFYFHQDVLIQEKFSVSEMAEIRQLDGLIKQELVQKPNQEPYYLVQRKSTKTNIPFLKNNELDYSIFNFTSSKAFTAIIYVFIVIFILTAVSNGANITDGLDGLAAGTSAIIGLTLAILAYVSGNTIFSEYLNIIYIPNLGELVIFCAAFTGACIGFLWYNSYPAQVFMGDTGSLTLGGIIAILALSIRKELLLPLLCGVFLIENLSVMLQVSYFKYTKKRSGIGRRIFRMAPLHHHYQKKGLHESKIVIRFWLVGIVLAILTLATLKLR